MSAIRKVDCRSHTACTEFNASLLDTGFAVLTNHGIDPGRINGVYSEWSAFLRILAKTPSLKKHYLRNLERFDGYFPCELAEVAKNASVRDLKQYFQLYHNGRYPDPTEVSLEAQELFNDMTLLGKKLLGWINTNFNTLEQEKLKQQGITNLTETLCVERTMMRILHYPAYDPSTVQPGQVRSAPHEDINWITILPTGSTKGLQICLDGENWNDVPFEPNSIIVNIGDMLQEFTEGRYHSTTHRVIATRDVSGEERVSIPCFIHAKKDVVLSHRKGKSFTAENYLCERIAELERLNAE